MRESRGLMGLPAPALGYDGTVITPDGPIEVKDGVMNVRGKTLHVDVDGTVLGPDDKPMARVVGGKLAPIQPQQQVQAQPQPGAQ